MLVHGTAINDMLIVRITKGGKLYFHTGIDDRGQIGPAWTTDRAKAKTYCNDKRLHDAVIWVPRGDNDQVVVMPSGMIEAVIKWHHNAEAERRRLHRLNRTARTMTRPVRTDHRLGGTNLQPMI